MASDDDRIGCLRSIVLVVVLLVIVGGCSHGLVSAFNWVISTEKRICAIEKAVGIQAPE